LPAVNWWKRPEPDRRSWSRRGSPTFFPSGYPSTASAVNSKRILGIEEHGAWQLFWQHTSATGVAGTVQIWPQ
jgi:hypothetical protein